MVAAHAGKGFFATRPAGNPIPQRGQLRGDIAANFAEAHDANVIIGRRSLRIHLPDALALVGQRPVKATLKPQYAPQRVFKHTVTKIFIHHPAERNVAGENAGGQMVYAGRRGLDQLQLRRARQQLRVGKPAAGVLRLAGGGVLGQNRFHFRE